MRKWGTEYENISLVNKGLKYKSARYEAKYTLHLI